MAAPIFPGITDCAKIIEACAPFASSMTFDTLNLRAGNRDKILNFVKTLRPGLAPLYRRIYAEGDRAYWRELRARIEADCRARGAEILNIFLKLGKRPYLCRAGTAVQAIATSISAQPTTSWTDGIWWTNIAVRTTATTISIVQSRLAIAAGMHLSAAKKTP